MKLAISGMSGVGKGECINKLCSLLEKEGLTYKVYKEDTNKQLYELAQNNKNLLYLNQLGRGVNFMVRDLIADSEKDKYDVQIFDRSSQELLFYNAEFLTSAQNRLLKQQLEHLYLNCNRELQYDMLLVLTASTTTILNRIKNRGRDELSPKMVKSYININTKYYNSDGYSKLEAYEDVFFIDNVTLQKMDEHLPGIVEEIKNKF